MRKQPICILSFVALAAFLTPVTAFGQYFYPQQVAQTQQVPHNANVGMQLGNFVPAAQAQQLPPNSYVGMQRGNSVPVAQVQQLPPTTYVGMPRGPIAQTQPVPHSANVGAQWGNAMPVAQVPQTLPNPNPSQAYGYNGQPAGSYYATAAVPGALNHALPAPASPNANVPTPYGAGTSGAAGTDGTWSLNGASNAYGATSYGDTSYSSYGSSCDGGCATGGCGTGGCGVSGCGIGYSDCGSCRPRACWYATAAGLYMTRDQSNRVWTTYETNNNSNQMMNTQNVNADFESGVDLRLGRYFCCNRWAVELGYWTVNNFEDSSSQTHAMGVSSPLAFNDLEFAVGSDPVAGYFDSAMEHRLYRRNELHNVELNLIEGNFRNNNCCNPWTHQMLVGVRYFKFDEDLFFDTLDQGGTWGGNGGLNEVRLSDSISNELFGVQVGCLFQRQIGCRTRFFITPKFGIYNNHIKHRFDLRRGDGTAAMPTAFSQVNGSYPVESTTDVVSFLSEANIGLQYQLSCRWSVFGGYRVVAMTGIGLADNQIPQYIVDIPEIADIDTNGSLVLHGAFFGIAFSL